MFSNNLSKSEEKKLYEPTFDFRNRIFLNTLKSGLLKEDHNPESLQINEFINALSFSNKSDKNIPDKRTLKTWWNGESKLSIERGYQLSLIANRYSSTSPSLLNILNKNDISTHISRHLLSIDARNIELSKGDAHKEKIKIAHTTINAIQKTWARFTDLYFEEGHPLDLLKQINGIRLQAATPPINPVHANSNWYASGLPSQIQNSFNRAQSVSLINFMVLLGSHLSPMSKGELEIWIIDLASLTNACMTLEYFETNIEGRMPFTFEQTLIITSTARMLWDNVQDPSIGLEQLTLAVPQTQKNLFKKTLIEASEKYYKVMKSIGISKSSLLDKLYLFETKMPPFMPQMRTFNGKLYFPSLAHS